MNQSSLLEWSAGIRRSAVLRECLPDCIRSRLHGIDSYRSLKRNYQKKSADWLTKAAEWDTGKFGRGWYKGVDLLKLIKAI